jgi:hypothetical protein
MDGDPPCRIVPNGPPAVLSNDCFEGHVMLLIRTPDVDDEDCANMADGPKQVSQYFKGKKRRFEFQFQIRLKRPPQGPLFLGCELEHPIHVGRMTKGLMGILLAMVRRINPGFHYSWGDKEKKDDGECCHLSFPVEASMDRIVISKPGDILPVLGQELQETNESVKRRRKTGAGCVDWNLDDTYTMCLWSAYADWIMWKSINVPGVSPFMLSRVTGTQPIYLCVYEITSCSPAEYRKQRGGIPHKRKDLRVYTKLEFAHELHTTGGLAQKLFGKSMTTEQSLPDTESLDGMSDDVDTASIRTA